MEAAKVINALYALGFESNAISPVLDAFKEYEDRLNAQNVELEELRLQKTSGSISDFLELTERLRTETKELCLSNADLSKWVDEFAAYNIGDKIPEGIVETLQQENYKLRVSNFTLSTKNQELLECMHQPEWMKLYNEKEDALNEVQTVSEELMHTKMRLEQCSQDNARMVSLIQQYETQFLHAPDNTTDEDCSTAQERIALLEDALNSAMGASVTNEDTPIINALEFSLNASPSRLTLEDALSELINSEHGGAVTVKIGEFVKGSKLNAEMSFSAPASSPKAKRIFDVNSRFRDADTKISTKTPHFSRHSPSEIFGGLFKHAQRQIEMEKFLQGLHEIAEQFSKQKQA